MSARTCALAVAWLTIAGRPVAADPAAVPAAPEFAHLNSPRNACRGTVEKPTDCVVLAPGYYLAESTWAKRNAEVKRRQDEVTRLTAENQVLRSAVASWQPG